MYIFISLYFRLLRHKCLHLSLLWFKTRGLWAFLVWLQKVPYRTKQSHFPTLALMQCTDAHRGSVSKKKNVWALLMFPFNSFFPLGQIMLDLKCEQVEWGGWIRCKGYTQTCSISCSVPTCGLQANLPKVTKWSSIDPCVEPLTHIFSPL